MRAADLKSKQVVIWGTGREGVAVAEFVHHFLPDKELVFVDEAMPDSSFHPGPGAVLTERNRMREAVLGAEVLIKSPGVSLNHELILEAKRRGVYVTSLLNLYFAEPRTAKTICVTGTKGKSTTATLIHRMLNGAGASAQLFGNIGVPISVDAGRNANYVVLEVSSYQAADFDGSCDVAVLTSLFPEHLDWHGAVDSYYQCKINLLNRAKCRIVSEQALKLARAAGLKEGEIVVSLQQSEIFETLTKFDNEYLRRPQNLSNLALALEVVRTLELDPEPALQAVRDFAGLPHRQRVLGERDGILYVDDSISTTPNSTIAALEVFKTRPVTLIAGGYDRGLGYERLVDYLIENQIPAVVCLGDSGLRIYRELVAKGFGAVKCADSMDGAVRLARDLTPSGGTILLSPAAPSFGMFRNYIERGEAFAKASGLT